MSAACARLFGYHRLLLERSIRLHNAAITMIRAAILALLTLTGCQCQPEEAPLRLDGLEPASGHAGVQIPVTVLGEGFTPAVRVSYRDPNRSEVNTVFEVRLGEHALIEIDYRDATHLSATVPPDLAPGEYTLHVRAPNGDEESLADAFEVLPGVTVLDGGEVELDGNRRDGELDDLARTDGGVPDTAQPDSATPDTSMPDTSLPDSSCPADWHSCDWDQRIKLTVQPGTVASPQASFPVYVDLADLGASFFNAVSVDGSDIVVTDASGITALPRELEILDKSGGSGALWFNAPALQDGSEFYIYYGNTSAAGTNSTTVWDPSFLAVWHNSVDPTGPAPQVLDSTSNSVHGTSQGGMSAGAQVSGKLGNTLEFDGVDDYIVVEGSTGTLDHTGVGDAMKMTICAWVNPDGLTTSFPSILSKGDTQYHMKLHSTDRWEFKSGGEWSLSDSPISAPFDQWYHVCGVNDGTDNLVYVNGVLQAETTTPASIEHDDYPVWMGMDSQNTDRDPFDGYIDELRFSDTARSADWIRTEFLNQDDAAAFFAVSVEQIP